MRVITVCAVAVLASACTPRINTDPATGRVDVDMEPVTQRGEVWDARITGRGPNSGLGGTGSVTIAQGHTVANVSLTGARSGAIHPWHVHEGTCATGGPVVGAGNAYPPLNVGTQGQANATAHVTVSLNEAKKYHINIHASPTDMGTIAGCGDLVD